jgi:hypothetical protein
MTKKQFKGINKDFEKITFKNKKVTIQEKSENTIFKRITKNDFVQKNKIIDDIKFIHKLINEFNENESVNLISSKFDSPNIIKALINEIQELYISTFSISPAGISSLLKLMEMNNCKKIILLMSSIHSSKWLITSGAYKILKYKVQIKLTANHSKFICIKTKKGFINFVGSMNFTNNPRYENIIIDKKNDTFTFYTNFINNVKGRIL